MSISKKDVTHIAHLSRIEMNEQEIEKFEKELSPILDYIVKLNEVDTRNVEPFSGGTELLNVMRKDKISNTRHVTEGVEKKLLDAAPEKKDGYIKVKAVFER